MIETSDQRGHRGPAHGARQGQRHEHRVLRGGHDARFDAHDRRRAPSCSPAAGGSFPPASICCGCSTAARLYPPIPAGAEHACSTRSSPIPSRWWRRSTATPWPAAACWPAPPTGASWRATPGRIGVTELLVGVPFPAARHGDHAPRRGAAIFGGRDPQRRDLNPPAAVARGLVHDIVEPDELLDRAIDAAKHVGGAFAAGIRDHQAADPPGPAVERSQRADVDADVDRHLDRARDARAHPRLCQRARLRRVSRLAPTPPPAPARGRR